MEPISLRVLVRLKLADGRLPHDSIPRIVGEPSHGEVCDACEETIAANQFVMEGTSTDSTKRTVQFHVACFGVRSAPRRAANVHTFR